MRKNVPALLRTIAPVALALGCAKVPERPGAAASVDVPLDVVFGNSSEELDVPDDWNVSETDGGRNFTGNGGTMDLGEGPVATLGIGLRPEVRYHFRRYAVGVFGQYQMFFRGTSTDGKKGSLGTRQPLRAVELDWYESVFLQAVNLRRYPTLGVLAGYRVGSDLFRLELGGYWCDLLLSDYRGVHGGGTSYYSVAYSERTISSGLGGRIGVDYRPGWSDVDVGRFGLLLELPRPGSYVIGLGYRGSIPILTTR